MSRQTGWCVDCQDLLLGPPPRGTLLSMVSLYDKHKSKMSSGLREKAPMPDRIRSDGEGVLGDAVHTVSCKSSYESKYNHAS